MKPVLPLLIIGILFGALDIMKGASGFVMHLKRLRTLVPLRSSVVVVQMASRQLSGRPTKAAQPLRPVRVRFAPSPTGSLHVGGARTAMFNWLLARKTNGTFIVRVEDTDEARSTRESEQAILADLRWLTLNWDEGPEVGGPFAPYRQSERKDIYKAAADKLLQEGRAYRCFCTEEELEAKRAAAEKTGVDAKYDGTWRDADPAAVQEKLAQGAPFTIRFRVPPGKIVAIDDIVRGRVTWDADASLGDFIIMRSNGMPVYNFCVSVDDAHMQITHVIRAEEHLTNTLRQLLILEALHVPRPEYAHCSLILGSDRSKLSKRHGATSVKQFSEQGYVPAAMLNYLANLGWNDGTPKEIYSPAELISAFDIHRITKAPGIFDMVKFTWINQQHLHALPADQIRPIVLREMTRGEDALLAESQQSVTSTKSFDDFLNVSAKLAQRDMHLTTDTNRLLGNCLHYDIDHTLRSDAHVMEVLNDSLSATIKQIVDDFNSGALPRGDEKPFYDLWKVYVKTLGATLGLKGKALFHPLRFCLTGRMSGPDIGDQLRLLRLAAKHVKPGYKFVPLEERMAQLSKFSVEDARKVATEAAAAAAAAAAASAATTESGSATSAAAATVAATSVSSK